MVGVSEGKHLNFTSQNLIFHPFNINIFWNVKNKLKGVLEPYEGQKGALITILQKTQEELGYLPEEAIAEIADFLGMTPNEVYGVATFYAEFRFKPEGKNVVKVCQGTACHVRGSHRILEGVQDKLGIEPGGVTEDHKFGVERVACVGCCALAPVMIVNDTVYAKMTAGEAKKILVDIDQGDQK